MNQKSQPILEVKDLAIAYETRRRDIHAVRGISFQVYRGETLGLVGESGCGKSTVAFGIVNFLGSNGKITQGSIKFQDEELVGCPHKRLRTIRGNDISMVFQDPMQALNPSLRLGEQLAEVLTCHSDMETEEAWERSIQMLKRVYMPDPASLMMRFPHQISGGQQQRVVIAMAMLNNPALLIMDEPTTALDVTVEAVVLDLIEDLKKDFDTGIIYITHNLGVIARVSNRLCVMYAGELVEQGQVSEIFEKPAHPYTRGLLRCVPRLDDNKISSRLYNIHGRVPPPGERPDNSCVFEPRCNHAKPECLVQRPDLEEITSGHLTRCLYGRTIVKKSIKSRFVDDYEVEEVKILAESGTPLLVTDHLRLFYKQKSKSILSFFGLGKKQYIKAVDDVSIMVHKGKTLGIVGESGCGKSTLVKGLIGLETITDGEAEFMGLDISKTVVQRDLNLIKEIQMVFQNPDSTLNPSYTVGYQIARPIKRFKTVPRKEVRAEVDRILKEVRLDTYYYERYPRQLSGGEKQRVGIARALASRPNLVICDEPVSALDVSVQAAVLNLLMEIQYDLGTTMIFIAHDLSVVRYLSDYIAVMYLGRIMEIGPTEMIYAPPLPSLYGSFVGGCAHP